MDINDIAAQAAAKIDAARDLKVQAVKTVAASGVRVTEAAEALAVAEQQYAKDHAAALRAEWSEADLRGFGIASPTRKSGGRPRGTKTTRKASEATQVTYEN
ncbi:hypothetical protein [Pseudarthrobacter sp. PS3-L1]|uniref:hypothetical protein n=1 Tax=Pseudarthrobacter sp. PS3-L1 TaxID=3046207 RepID=UPI0024BAB107|nr:hypothetical protein [Pseudarthrobacter sp. PS3-L1]MDJ0321978.1 hypothetical protein [Pseudarthrobacter sp. PS3-L1]